MLALLQQLTGAHLALVDGASTPRRLRTLLLLMKSALVRCPSSVGVELARRARAPMIAVLLSPVVLPAAVAQCGRADRRPESGVRCTGSGRRPELI